MDQSNNSFTIDLFPEGASYDSDYHVQNSPGEEQRQHLVDLNKGTDFHVQADIFLIAHGTISPGGDPATLIALYHNFLAPPTRQYHKATIEYTFSPISPHGGEDLEIFRLIPYGQIDIKPTIYTRIVDSQRSQGFNFGINAPPNLGAISIHGTNTMQTQTVSSVRSKGTIQGIARFADEKVGKKNQVRWVLMENPNNPGIPHRFDTAILIKRKTSQKFQATIKIRATCDKLFWSKGVFTSRDTVDPLVLNPGLPPQGIALDEPGLAIDSKNLKSWTGLERLEEFYASDEGS